MYSKTPGEGPSQSGLWPDSSPKGGAKKAVLRRKTALPLPPGEVGRSLRPQGRGGAVTERVLRDGSKKAAPGPCPGAAEGKHAPLPMLGWLWRAARSYPVRAVLASSAPASHFIRSSATNSRWDGDILAGKSKVCSSRLRERGWFTRPSR